VTTVLLVDDHPVYRRGLGVLLRAAGFDVVGEAASGLEAIAAVATHRPDVVLMDLGMPELGGTAATERILAEYPATRVVVVTMFGDEESVRAALAAGAVGYVLKDSPPAQVEAAVVAAASGARHLGPGVPFPAAAPAAAQPEAFRLLTARERDVAALLAKGLSNRTIGERLGVSDKTVANYVAGLRLKLGAVDRHDAARIVRGDD
jgi:DNA-binding NarL/FixJ family response regulator